MQQVSVDPMLGAVVGGRYRVQAKLGNGAMGSVYRCTDARGGPEVAAKVLAPGLADALKAEARFRQEIKAATLLAHPNIVETHDFGHTDDGRPFYIMELVEGASLASVIKSSAPIELSRALRVARDVAAGLEHAHAKGIVHRDIKPDNIMIGDVSGSESAKILDFGILKILAGGELTVQQFTKAGSIVGTLPYLAPEALSGQSVDGRADLYALGCVLFEMLTASRPHSAADPMGLMHAILSAPAPSLADRGVRAPAAVDALVRSLLAKDVEDRPANAAQVIAQLDAVLAPSPTVEPSIHAQQTHILQVVTPPKATAPAPKNPHTDRTELLDIAPQLAAGQAIPTEVVALPRFDRAASSASSPVRLPPGAAYAFTGLAAVAILLAMVLSICE